MSRAVICSGPRQSVQPDHRDLRQRMRIRVKGATAGLPFSSPRLGRTATISLALVAGAGARAEEHSNVFVYEPGVIIGPHYHACLEAQRCIGKRLNDHTVSRKASVDRLRKDGHPYVVRY
jgi:hypothetical protein